jgi:hypothetical protein
MSDVPPAIVESPRPPLRPRPERAAALRKALKALAVIAACFLGWKFLIWYTRSDSNKQLEARQDKARKRIGPGFDKLFDRMLDKDRESIDFVANLAVDPKLGAGYDASDCAKGFNDAFGEALGSDVVYVSTLGIEPDPATQLEITGKVTPSDEVFQLPNSDKVYPGIALSADMKLLGHKLHTDIVPTGEIEFTHTQFGVSFGEGMSPEDVAGGLLQGTCRQAAYALLESMTTWRRPPPPPRPDPQSECERGFNCRENAQLLEEKDPATAAKLYAHACDNDDEDACLRGAELEMQLTKGIDEHRAQADMMLEMACMRDLARTCAASARIELMPLEPGKPPSEYAEGKALGKFLRACDLGDSDSCTAAVPLLKHTPLSDAAPLLTGKHTVKSRTLGTIFALRWGQWTQLDEGQATAWVTTEPAHPPEGAIVTPFSLDRLPPGITAPDGASTVYAIALRGGNDRCNQCSPSGGGKSVYMMRSMSCVCAIAPKQ